MYWCCCHPFVSLFVPWSVETILWTQVSKVNKMKLNWLSHDRLDWRNMRSSPDEYSLSSSQGVTFVLWVWVPGLFFKLGHDPIWVTGASGGQLYEKINIITTLLMSLGHKLRLNCPDILKKNIRLIWFYSIFSYWNHFVAAFWPTDVFGWLIIKN